MIIKGKIVLGTLLTALAILLEAFWIQTDATVLGIFTLVIASIASCIFAKAIRLDYETDNPGLRKFFTIVGLEN